MFSMLKKNLLAGLRLAPSHAFSVGFDQAATLFLVCVVVVVILSYPFGTDSLVLDWTGLTSWAAIAFVFTVVVLVMSRLQNAASVGFATQILASAPWFLLVTLLVTRFMPEASWSKFVLIVLGFVIVLVVALRAYRGLNTATIVFLLALPIIAWTVGWYRFITPAVFYNFDNETTDAAVELDIEKVFRSQTELVEARLSSILPQRPDYSDIYFVGFSGNADEPVFRRDLDWVHGWFDKNFGTTDRSVVLSASIDELETQPVASRYNLQDVLAGLGQVIDPNEDSIFLYLVSHGSRAGWLETSLHPLPLQKLTAESVKQALDEAGIRWRIIVVSACYSGSFIETLADDQTLIMTASAADKTSFGCGWESDITWFTDALFKQGLAQGMGLMEAFDHARQYIAEREAEQGISASDPQIFVGEAMRLRLAEIETAVGLID